MLLDNYLRSCLTSKLHWIWSWKKSTESYLLTKDYNLKISGRRTMYVKEFNKMELAITATVPKDSGIYQCVAVNDAGEIWAAGRLQVNTSRNSPAAPTSLKCEARSPVKIFISWEPPKFLPSTNITAYTVHYSDVGECEEKETFLFWKSTMLLINTFCMRRKRTGGGFPTRAR